MRPLPPIPSALPIALIPLTLGPCAALAAPGWPSPAERGWTEVGALAHLHSPYSHDACDGEGLPGGAPDPTCLARMRQAFCETGRVAYFLTDHPAHMTEYSFYDDLLYDPAEGDTLHLDAQGRPLANELTCLDGGQMHSVFLYVGYETTNTMPLALDEHVPDGVTGVHFNTDSQLEDAVAAIGAVHAAGGFAAIAHAEEDAVTPERVLAEGADALELYNAHANINVLLSRHPLELLDLEQWVEGALDPPVSDYVALVAFQYLDGSPREKWDALLPTRLVPGLVGTDVHENVTLDPYCAIQPIDTLCGVLARKYPNLVAWLTEGGPIPMADGERLDSYDRMFRWFSNHLLTPSVDPEALEATLKAGRSYVAFDILANPEGFDFALTDDSGRLTEMGGTAPWQPDTTLLVRVAQPAGVDVRGEAWTREELSQAVITGRLLRLTAAGVEEVARLGRGGDVQRIPAPGPGVYRVELSIEPRHLVKVMGDQPQLARKVYPWLWSNPIRVE